MDNDDFDDDEDFGLGDVAAEEPAQQSVPASAPQQSQQSAAGTAPPASSAAPAASAPQAEAADADGDADDLYGDVIAGVGDAHTTDERTNGSALPRLSHVAASQPKQAQQGQPQASPSTSAPAQQPAAAQSSSSPAAGSAQQQEGGSAVFIGNLQWWTTDADLENACVEFGTVAEVQFTEEKANGRSKGYARVHFAEPSAAEACKVSLNGRDINGKAAIVTLAKSVTSTAQASDTGGFVAGRNAPRPPFIAGRGGPPPGGFTSVRVPRPPGMQGGFRPGMGPGPMPGGMGGMHRPGMVMGGMPGRPMMGPGQSTMGPMGERGPMPFMNGRGMQHGGMGVPMGMPSMFGPAGGQLSAGMPGSNMPPGQMDHKRRRL